MEHPTLLMNEMQVFARVVEQQSFAGAARQMGLTTSAVSRSVARLEHQLGIKLLNRTTRSLSLTDAGAEVHAGCLRLMHEAEQLQSLASQHREQPHGLLRISAPAVFGEMWLAPRIPAYCERWPEVQVQLSSTDDWVDLVADRIDLAIRIAEPGLITPGLVARPLVPVRYRLVASPAYLEKNAPITEPQDLLAHRFISLGLVGWPPSLVAGALCARPARLPLAATPLVARPSRWLATRWRRMASLRMMPLDADLDARV